MQADFSPAYKRYAVFMLAALYGVNFLDGAYIALLMQPIKVDLGLSDTQLGMLTGIAFGLLYAILGVPIARWADRGANRVNLIVGLMALGSLAAMGLYWVSAFIPLLLLRVVAGASDAGANPLTYSLLGDYCPSTAERTRALYTRLVAGAAVAMVGKWSGGWLNEQYGWRVPFLVVGLLGLFLAVLAKLTLIEPRTRITAAQSQVSTAPPMREVLMLLWSNRTCRWVLVGLVLCFMVGNGALVWNATLLIRLHQMGTAEVGWWMGLQHGLGAVTGMLLGRFITGRWLATNVGAQMAFGAASLLLGAPILLVFLLASDKYVAVGAMVLMSLVLGIFAASPLVVLQQSVPESMRATALMVVMLLATLIGYGAGPLIVGFASDRLTPTYGVEALRYAMSLGALGWIGASICYFKVANSLKDQSLKPAPDK